MTKDKDAAVRSQDFEKAGALRDREMELKAKIQVIIQGAKEQSKAEVRRSRGLLSARLLLRQPHRTSSLKAECASSGVVSGGRWRRHAAMSDEGRPCACCARALWQAESVEGGGPTVTEADIASIVAQWTGIPIEKARASSFPSCLSSPQPTAHGARAQPPPFSAHVRATHWCAPPVRSSCATGTGRCHPTRRSG